MATPAAVRAREFSFARAISVRARMVRVLLTDTCMFRQVMLAALLGLTTTQAAAAAARAETATSCRMLPAGKRIVKLNLKPDTNVADLLAWIASITCKQFILPGNIPATSKTVTIVSPQLLTPDEAYRLFLDALDSIGLTVYRQGAYYRVIESSKASHSPIPFAVEQASSIASQTP